MAIKDEDYVLISIPREWRFYTLQAMDHFKDNFPDRWGQRQGLVYRHFNDIYKVHIHRSNAGRITARVLPRD